MERKVKFEYFEVVSRKKNQSPETPDEPFDLTRWINIADGYSLEARTFDYSDERVRLERMKYFDDTDLWLLNFLRLRETDIPLRGKIDQEAEPIELDDDEFIGEDVSMLYDPELNVVMLQRNIRSLGATGIEKYLNLLWASNGEQEEKIYLRPILNPFSFEKASGARYYRKISVRFAQLPPEVSIFNSPIKKIVEAFGEYQGITAEITISIGQGKKNNLKSETVVETIADIKNNKSFFKKAQLTLKESEDDKVEILDLIEEKLHDYIIFQLPTRQSLACEYVFQEMINRYRERRYDIIRILQRDG